MQIVDLVLKNLTHPSNYQYINCLQSFCVCKTGSMSESCNTLGTFEHDYKRPQLSLCHFKTGLTFTQQYFICVVDFIFTQQLPRYFAENCNLSVCLHPFESLQNHLGFNPFIRPCFPPFTLVRQRISTLRKFRMQFPSLRKSALKWTVVHLRSSLLGFH